MWLVLPRLHYCEPLPWTHTSIINIGPHLYRPVSRSTLFTTSYLDLQGAVPSDCLRSLHPYYVLLSLPLSQMSSSHTSKQVLLYCKRSSISTARHLSWQSSIPYFRRSPTVLRKILCWLVACRCIGRVNASQGFNVGLTWVARCLQPRWCRKLDFSNSTGRFLAPQIVSTSRSEESCTKASH